MQQRIYTNVLFRKRMSDMALGGRASIREGLIRYCRVMLRSIKLFQEIKTDI